MASLVRHVIVLCMVWGMAMMPLVNSAHADESVDPQVTTTPAALNRELMGMVIRDPWYDFGTNPRYPNKPNYAAQAWGFFHILLSPATMRPSR